VTERRSPLEDSVRKLIHFSIGLYVIVLLLILGGAGSAIYVVLTNHDTRDALCTFRTDLEVRVASSRKFLDEHPEGLPKAGISAQQLSQSIRNQDRTVDALRGLDCS
jgi:hypothetical protein